MKRIILIGNKSFIQQNLFIYFKSKNMKVLKVKFDQISRFKIFNNDIDFSWEVNSADDWRQPWKDWVSTRYYEKAKRAGRKITFLIFKRR